MIVRTLLATLLLPMAAQQTGAFRLQLDWWITHSLEKVRPSAPLPAAAQQRPEIHAARNEFEAFQIVLRAGEQPIGGLDIEFSDFHDDAGHSIQSRHITAHFEKFLDLPKASSQEGSGGLWPDPLIPRVDRYEHEMRNAFPFALRPGVSQPLWIEIFIPASAFPGVYRAEARILHDGTTVVTVPIKVTVWAFTLPVTATLRSSFGLNGTKILKEHMGGYTSDSELYGLTHRYSVAALQHRISTHGGSGAPPKHRSGRKGIEVDWAAYDAEVGPLIEGTAIPAGEALFGARATSIELRTPAAFASDKLNRQYWSAWIDHFAAKRWDRNLLFLYLWDEPTVADYPKVAQRGRAARLANSHIRNLVTVPFTEALEGSVDIWVSLINCLENKPGNDPFCSTVPPLEVYDRQTRSGKRLWVYQSCASHGCNIIGGSYFSGWPRYVIDAPGTGNRVMQWIAWSYRAEGELYFNMVESYDSGQDPWTNVHLFGGNGDGTLFYPGAPAVIGGRTHIPIESIRLKLIREGMEDYEYLAMIATHLGRETADRFAARIVTNAYRWESQAQAFLAVRREMGEALDRVTRVPLAGRPRG